MAKVEILSNGRKEQLNVLYDDGNWKFKVYAEYTGNQVHLLPREFLKVQDREGKLLSRECAKGVILNIQKMIISKGHDCDVDDNWDPAPDNTLTRSSDFHTAFWKKVLLKLQGKL